MTIILIHDPSDYMETRLIGTVDSEVMVSFSAGVLGRTGHSLSGRQNFEC